jgi:sterol desaturase/sphingolipid hydroxylase (fatty acid hydroxylase superfamily)
VVGFPVTNLIRCGYTFNHANISLPKKVDTVLSYFIVSPDMHKVHHHYVLPIQIVIMAIYFLFGTVFWNFYDPPKEEIVYGIDTHQKPEEHNELKIY